MMKSKTNLKAYGRHGKDARDIFHYLSAVMSRNRVQSVETINDFRIVAAKFGATYEQVFNKKSAPNFHLSEVHVIYKY